MGAKYERIAGDVRHRIVAGGRVRRAAERYQWEKDRALLSEAIRRTTGATEYDTGLSIGDLEFFARYQTIEADSGVAAVFEVPVGTRILRRDYRTRLKGDGSPVSLTTSYLVYGVVAANPRLLDADEEPWPGGTQHQLHTVNIEIDRIVESITARPPSATEMAELDIPSGVAVLAVRKQMIDTKGRTVEFSDIVLPGDRTELVFVTQLSRWDRP
ncbi:UTRA domain-containing protein [Nocardia sp. NPDC005998]|uniref:UTRA domain-containing protein n=1 Tax=Nocardia sp. NPDC005998 TaxID=3156894 RepID=UPI0033ADE6E3